MSRFSIRILRTFLLIFFISSGFGFTQSNGIAPISIQLSPSSNTIVNPQSPLPISVKIKNHSNSKIRLYKKIQFLLAEYTREGLMMEIVKNGDTIPNRGYMTFNHIRPIKNRDFKTIQPGSTWKLKRDINLFSDFIDPGTYEVRVYLKTEPDEEFKITQLPPVYSNWITISVLPRE